MDEVTRYSFCSKTHTFTDTVSMIAESFYFYLSSDALGFFLERDSLRIVPHQTKASTVVAVLVAVTQNVLSNAAVKTHDKSEGDVASKVRSVLFCARPQQ